MEAEARAILSAACEAGNRQPIPPEDAIARAKRLQAVVDQLYGDQEPKNAVEELIAERRREAAREATE